MASPTNGLLVAVYVSYPPSMARSFPQLGIKDLAGRQLSGPQGQAPQRLSQAPPVAGARASAPAPSNNVQQRRVELDRSDRGIMRALGIDVNNKIAVKRFAKEKFERLRQEQR